MSEKLRKRITDVARQLQKEGQTFTRSDLAYQLSSDGAADDFELEKEVWFAQKEYNFSEKLFLTNDRQHTLVEAYEMQNALLTDDSNGVENVVRSRMALTQKSINKAEKSLEIRISEDALRVAGGVMSHVTGTHGIEKTRAKAEVMFDKYTKMVDMYTTAQSDVSLSVDDFVTIRGDVLDKFLRYSSALTDIFSEQIKVVSPDLFDFNDIKWLDVSSMHKQMQLEYNTITSKCGNLLSEIVGSFRNALQQSSNTFNVVEDKRVGLALAGLNMLGHYLDAYQQTNTLQSDLMRFERLMTKDKTQIQGDLMRLATIYKALNDVHIPKALAFLRYSEQLLSGGIQELLDSIYSNPKVANLRQHREELLAQLREIDNNIRDCQTHIEYYAQHIKDSQEMLQSMKEQYRNAKMTMPSKPLFLFNWLTLGSLGRNYNRDIFEWSQRCLPVVKSYEDLELDLKLDTEDIKNYKEQLKHYEKEYNHNRIELNDINKKLMSLVNADDNTKRKMLKSLKDILRLMALAKEIAQTKLDASLTEVVKIRDFNDYQLPATIEQGLDTFFDTLQNNLKVSTYDAMDITDELGSAAVTPQNVTREYSEEDMQAVADKSNEVLQKGINICRQMVELQKQKINTESAKIHYNEELLRLQKEFRAQYESLDDKSNALMEIMSELNSLQGSEAIRDALLKLSDGKLLIPTDEELSEFIKGNKQIEI